LFWLCCILVKDLHDKAFVQKWVLGFDELKKSPRKKLHSMGSTLNSASKN